MSRTKGVLREDSFPAWDRLERFRWQEVIPVERLRPAAARDGAGKRELLEQALQSGGVLGNGRVELAVRAFEVRVRDDARPTVAGARHVEHREVALDDRAVEVAVDEVQARRRAPVPEESDR